MKLSKEEKHHIKVRRLQNYISPIFFDGFIKAENHWGDEYWDLKDEIKEQFCQKAVELKLIEERYSDRFYEYIGESCSEIKDPNSDDFNHWNFVDEIIRFFEYDDWEPEDLEVK